MDKDLNTRKYNDIKRKYGVTNAISHMLRTPATCILGFSRLLEATNLTSQQKEYIYNIEESTHHLLAATDCLAKDISSQKQYRKWRIK